MLQRGVVDEFIYVAVGSPEMHPLRAVRAFVHPVRKDLIVVLLEPGHGIIKIGDLKPDNGAFQRIELFIRGLFGVQFEPLTPWRGKGDEFSVIVRLFVAEDVLDEDFHASHVRRAQADIRYAWRMLIHDVYVVPVIGFEPMTPGL